MSHFVFHFYLRSLGLALIGWPGRALQSPFRIARERLRQAGRPAARLLFAGKPQVSNLHKGRDCTSFGRTGSSVAMKTIEWTKFAFFRCDKGLLALHGSISCCSSCAASRTPLRTAIGSDVGEPDVLGMDERVSRHLSISVLKAYTELDLS